MGSGTAPAVREVGWLHLLGPLLKVLDWGLKRYFLVALEAGSP